MNYEEKAGYLEDRDDFRKDQALHFSRIRSFDSDFHGLVWLDLTIENAIESLEFIKKHQQLRSGMEWRLTNCLNDLRNARARVQLYRAG